MLLDLVVTSHSTVEVDPMRNEEYGVFISTKKYVKKYMYINILNKKIGCTLRILFCVHLGES